MDSHVVETVTGWESVSVDKGYAGLRDLAEREFSGAVAAGQSWAFVLNGRIVGVFDGSIEDFEGAQLRGHAAPDPALPLLFAMRARGGETRAKYYTNDTPLAQADETLSSGGFTGYVELSENVLSGDYYVVYYGGKSMSVAYVGNSRRLISGDEAFEQANDEVGIYSINEVDLDLIELPETDDRSEGATGSGSEESDPATGSADEGDVGAAGADEGVDEDDATSAVGPDDAGTPAAGAAPDEAAVPSGAEENRPAAAASTATAETPDAEADASAVADAEAAETAGDESAADDETGGAAPGAGGDPEEDVVIVDVPDEADAESADEEADDRARAARGSDGPAAGGAAESGSADAAQKSASRRAETDASRNGERTGGDSDVFSQEAQWRETKSIPALDPGDTAGESSDGDAPVQAQTKQRPRRGAIEQSRAGEQRSRDVARKLHTLKEKLQELAQVRDRLESERDELREERDALLTERDDLAEERDRLEARAEELAERVAELEDELERARAEGDGAAAPERTMNAPKALAGTNLFVRYADKGDPTLEAAHAGRASSEEVNANLRLEHHTSFETEGLAVDDRPFDEFLEETVEYRFVEWIVRDLPYEIQGTGNQQHLDGLYDAIPKIDRIELRGSVPVDEDDDAAAHEFDVVLWDSMGNPLLVANLNTGRSAAGEGMVATIANGATEIAEAADSLGAAFVVTSSYFSPGALDVAAEQTGGGLLSRGKRKSFVKLSRKRGFHLCLIEARNDEFYVNFPDL